MTASEKLQIDCRINRAIEDHVFKCHRDKQPEEQLDITKEASLQVKREVQFERIKGLEDKLSRYEQGAMITGTVESEEDSAIGFVPELDRLLLDYIDQWVRVIVLKEDV